MVNITPEEYMAKKTADRSDYWTIVDRMVIGPERARLYLHLESGHLVGKQAELLAGLADEMKVLAVRRDVDERVKLVNLRVMVGITQQKLDDICGKSRKRK